MLDTEVMNHVSQKPPPAPFGFPIFTVLGAIALLLLLGVSLLRNHGGGNGSAPPPAAVSEPDTAHASLGEPARTSESAADTPSTAGAGRGNKGATRLVSSGQAGVTVAADAASAGGQELIRNLTQLRMEGDKLTAEQAQTVRQSLQQLGAQGPAAIPAIRAFLDQYADVDFGKGSGDSVGASSLRTGLLETLRQIGGPEALAVSRQVLQTTGDPLEIAQIARNLEEAAPGQFNQEAADAARATLDKIAQSQMTNNVDVAPLFQALASYGGANAIPDLANFSSKWNYYATLALAGLPSGQGIPALTQLAMDNSEAGAGHFALQMLAQLASRYPDAGAALVDFTRQNQVPDSAWPAISEVLAGQQYVFTRQYPDNMFSSLNGPDLHTYRQPNFNQTFLSTVTATDGAAVDPAQRLALFDQLLAANPGPAALQALQQARDRLSAAAAGK